MPKKLEQLDIDALFAAARAKSAGNGGSETSTPYVPYNFKRAGQISTQQLRAISTINDQLARNLVHSLGAWLRTKFSVALVACEQMPYGEFLERLGRPTYVCSLQLEPMDTVGLLEVELSLALPILDLLAGGSGTSASSRELTEIEEELMTSLLHLLVTELNDAWLNLGLKFAFEKRETEAQVTNVMSPSERTLCVSFEVRMPTAQGSVLLCLPLITVNAMLRRLIAEGDRPKRRSTEARMKIRELLAPARVGAVLQLPPMKLPVSALKSMSPGSILRLPIPADQVAEFRIAGKCVRHACPVRVGEHRGLLIQASRLQRDATAAEKGVAL